MSSSFRIPHLFVVPVGNTLPTTGSTNALTAGQFGIYRSDYTVATAANAAAAAAAGLQIFQGNHVPIPRMGNKRSDLIRTSNLVSWYKVPALTSSTAQITEVDDLVVQCDEEVTLTLRLDSNLISNAYFNGLTRSVMVQAPCCDCGEDPCATITDDQYDDFYAALVTAINNDELLSDYITASTTGTHLGGDIKLILTGKALTNPFPTSSDVHNDPFRYDALRFHTFIHNGPEVSQDLIVEDRCDIPGVVTVTQRATYPHGLAAEVKKMEVDLFSYMVPFHKTLFQDADYNGLFSSQVTAAAYDMYYLKYRQEVEHAFNTNVPMLESSIIAVPTGEGAGIEAILVAAFGAASNKASTGAVSFTPLVP